MTKIKKSIWSVVVGVVMSLALVFGVFAGVNANKVANAVELTEDQANQYVAEFKFIMTNCLEGFNEPGGYTTEMLVDDYEYTVAMDDDSFTRTSTRMNSYYRAYELYDALLNSDYSALLSADRYVRMNVEALTEIKEMIDELTPIINNILGMEEGQLGYMVAREEHYYDCVGTHQVRYYDPENEDANELGYVLVDNTTNGVKYSDTEAYEAINTTFEALDEYQQEYVRRNANRGYNLHVVGSALAVANEMMSYVKDESLELQKLIIGQTVEEVWVPGTGVLYSYKARFDALVDTYKDLDPTAMAEENVALAYSEVSGLAQVFADIEAKADDAKDAIAAMEYWSPTSKTMVPVPLGTPLGENEVVVDTQETFDAATLALNSIYDGRTVNGFKVGNYATFAAVPETEKDALATYFEDLDKYLDAEETLAGYKAEAAEVEEDIEGLVVDATNHYKVLEADIDEVYGEYAELDVDGYNGHHNKQKYIAQDNRDKIENYKETLDLINAWIKGVAELVNDNNATELDELALQENPTVADVDAVIAWAYAKLQAEEDFGFDVNDKDVVDGLLETYANYVEVEDEVDAEARVNSLHDAHEVLVYLQTKIDEAIEEEERKIEELKDLLDDIGELLVNGVKYADRVVYDHFTEVYQSLSIEVLIADLEEEENWKNYEYLGEALTEIAKRVSEMTHVSELKAAIAGIEYHYEEDEDCFMSTEAQMGEVGDVVVDSEESIDAATAKIEAVYNGDEFYTEDDEPVFKFKIAELTYVLGENWAEDVVIYTNDEEEEVTENAFVHYGLLTQAEYDKYDAAVEDLNALKERAAAVETRIEELEITHYRNQREAIETLYNDYCALNEDEHNNLQVWVENGEKIEEAHEVLVVLDRWVYMVALAIDNYNDPEKLNRNNTTVEEIDTFINETEVEDVKLTLSQVETFLGIYNNIIDYDVEENTWDVVKALSVKEAHDLLVHRKDAIQQLIDDLQEDINALEEILTDGVKYADRKTFEELEAKLEELLRVCPEEELKTENLDLLGEALEEIATRAMNLGEYIDSILYRYVLEEEYAMGTYEEAGDERQVVAASRETIEAAQAAVAKVYNGDEFYTEDEEPVFKFKIAELAYVLGENWAEDVVTYTNDEEEEVTENAFVYYFGESVDIEAYFARYDEAVEALDALKALAAELQADIEEQLIDVLSEENHYRTLRTTIVELYERYQALADYDEEENEVRGEFDNLQPWVTRVVLDNDEPVEIDGGEEISEAYETLVALEGWREAVAVAIDAYNDPAQLSEVPTLEEVDALISGTEAEDVQLTLTQVNALLANYETVTGQDPIKKAAVADAYELLKARKDEIDDDTNDLKDRIAQLNPEDVTYKAKPTYDELKAEYDRLVALGVEFTPDDVANLTAVGDALAEIEERTSALKEAIDYILYYVEPEELDEEAEEDTCMVNDTTGEVVYATRESLLAAKAAIEAVYPENGQDNIAKLGATWYEDATEVEAFLEEYAEFAGITAEDVAQYVDVLARYLELENAAKAVAQRIDDLTLTAEDHFKAQEATINQLLEDLKELVHEEVLHNHNNWIVNPILVDTIHHDATDYEEEYDEPVYEYEYALDLEGNVIFPEAYIQKLSYVYLMLSAINQFDCEVANFVTGEEVADPENPLTEELIASIDAVLVEYADVDLSEVYTFDVKAIYDLLNQYKMTLEAFDEEVDPEFNIFPEINPAEYKDAYVAAVKPAKDILDNYYEAARELNNELVEIIVDICEKNDPEFEDKTLSEADEEKINYVKEVYEQLTWSQKAILENDYENHYEPFYDEEGEECGGYYWNEEILEYFYEDGWNNISPRTIDEFFNIAQRFEGANYYKQAVEELVTQLGEEYFTVEGYVLEKGLLAMYFTFDQEMKDMVESAYRKLLNIDAAYKEVEREDYTSYTTVTDDLEGQLEDAKTELAEAQDALETEIKEALGDAEAETVKEALENYKAAVEQAQADLEAAKDALVAEITNSLDPEAESVTAAFDTYKAAVAQAQADLEAAQNELVTEIKTALGEEEAETVQAALENYKAAVAQAQAELENTQAEQAEAQAQLENTQAEQAQTQAEAAKAAEDGNKENEEKVEKLKKALIITAVVGGVVAVAAVACIIALFAKMSALGGAAAGSSAAAGGAAGAEGGKEE